MMQGVREQVKGQAKWKCVNHKPLTHGCTTLERFKQLLFQSTSLPATVSSKPLFNSDLMCWFVKKLSDKQKTSKSRGKEHTGVRKERKQRKENVGKRLAFMHQCLLMHKSDMMCVSKSTCAVVRVCAGVLIVLKDNSKTISTGSRV